MESRRISKSILPLIVLGYAAIIALIAVASDFGQIKGLIIDKSSHQPIVGASIEVIGTELGAISDANGKYTIRAVPPGTYALKVSTVGYVLNTIKGVIVLPKLTAECNVALNLETSDLKESIEVYGEQVIDKYEVSSMSNITNRRIKARPVKSVKDLLNTISGVVKSDQGETHIRGGRAGEIAYVIDGVKISNQHPGSGSVI